MTTIVNDNELGDDTLLEVEEEYIADADYVYDVVDEGLIGDTPLEKQGLPRFGADELFVHLNVHSDFSQIDSTVRIDELVSEARNRGIAAVALTDEMNICGAVKFYKSCLDFGVKPIIGAQLLINDRQGNVRRLTALAQNPTGYYHLCELITQAYRHRESGTAALIEQQWFEDYNLGLAVLIDLESHEYNNEIIDGNTENISLFINDISQTFKEHTYLEIHRFNDPQSATIHQAIFDYSNQLNIPLIATNAVRFVDHSDYDIHQIRIAISDGLGIGNERRNREYYREQYLKSGAEMRDLFADAPNVIENTLELARQCTTSLHLGEYFLPDFPIPQGLTEAQFLRTMAEEGLEERLAKSTHPIEDPQSYRDRLNLELDVIDRMGFNGYFLIVADFIQWAKAKSIPVGPGRGSGAGSIAAWVLKITDIDPIRYGLLFERFLNPERVSMPDFDIDFCQERREEVIQYVADKYGKENVGQIITFGTLAAKNSIRDVGRVLGYGYNQCDAIARLVPNTPGITLSEALRQTLDLQDLIENDEEARTIFENAHRVEGLTRNFGTHAAGVVIGPKALSHYTAVYSESRDDPPVVQFNMKDIETAGLVKFDFLGLTTLTIIDYTVRVANEWRAQQGEAPLDITLLEPDDPKVYEALTEGDTHSVFQMESASATDLSINLQPDTFEEIIDMMAINRPGPLGSGMDKMYIDVKHKRAEPRYLHPSLEPILEDTKGVILYQEQVMEICRQMAGYSLGQADLMRRAMGKKIVEEMNAQAEIFIEGATKKGIQPGIARAVFDLIAEFANYGFNKSHSAAYAVLAYQTAYLKVYYRAAFYVANMNLALNNTGRIVSLISQAYKYGIAVEPPNINSCESDFLAVDAQTIRYGLGAIKGVGEAIIDKIVDARGDNGGSFSDLYDFFSAIGSKLMNKRAFEALVKAGAFDVFNTNRAECIEQYQDIVAWVSQLEKQKESGQYDLFSQPDGQMEVERPALPTTAPWATLEKLSYEREVLGFYLENSPLEIWYPDLKPHITCPLGAIDEAAEHDIKISAGTYISHRNQYTKGGEKLLFIVLRDGFVDREIAIRGSEADAILPALVPENVLLFRFQNYTVKKSDISRRRILGIFDIKGLIAFCAKSAEIRIGLGEEHRYADFFAYAANLPKGHTLVNFYIFDESDNRLQLAGVDSHSVQFSADDIIKIREMLGTNNFKMRFAIPWKDDRKREN